MSMGFQEWSARMRSVFVAGVVGLVSGCDLGSTGDSGERVTLELVASGLTAPVGLIDCGDGRGRLFVVEQGGVIKIIDADGALLPDAFLDVSGSMVGLSGTYDERGLLGLAFHPDYSRTGRFYVFYTAPRDDDDPVEIVSENRVSEFRVSADDPNRGDLSSERVLLDINKPQSNHNGGQLAFGRDGFLYIGTGDGGGANDSGSGHTEGLGNAQDRSSLLGKILRIDVDGGDPYGIPADNPFADGAAGRAEIWALGLRNPWRFSFDMGGAGRLFAGDVGQDSFEEVDIVVRGGNYGWNIREGAHCFARGALSGELCDIVDASGGPLIDPILEYPQVGVAGRAIGISVIGGFVYRGDAVPALSGQYVFADYSVGFFPDGTLFAAIENEDGTWTHRELSVAGTLNGRIGRYILALGQDAAGELYVLTSTSSGPSGVSGQIYRVVSSP